MLHRASLVPSSDLRSITATLCITACQTTIFKGYRAYRLESAECCRKIVCHCKLHDANITQPTFLRISIGYRCAAESTTRLTSSVIKPSNCKNLRILYTGLGLLSSSRHTDSRVFWGHLRQICQQSSITNIAARRFSCCAPTVWNSLPSFVRSLRTADSFTSFRSQLRTYMFARHL